jgi:hypothetical protein
MELIIPLDNTTAERLSELATFCGMPKEQLAVTFIKDSAESYSIDKHELRESLVESKP